MIRGLKFYSLFLAPLLIAIVFSAYVSFLDSPGCACLLGTNVSLLGLLAFCFVLPGTFAIGSMYLLYFSIRVRGRDFYPPTDVPWIGIFKTWTGRQAKIPKAAGYLIPIFGVWLVWLGFSVFIDIADGRTLSEISTASGAACGYS